MKSDFWLGLAFSVPLGIAVNLVSPTIGRRLEASNRRASENRIKQRALVRAQAAQLATDQTAYYSYLLSAVLRTTYITALFGLVGVGASMALPAIGLLDDSQGSIYGVLNGSGFFVSQMATLIAAVLILNIARSALGMVQEVQRIKQGPPAR